MELLHETAEFVVCVKPVNIPSQPDAKHSESMISLLSAYCNSEIFPVHRLDKIVGGLMLYAKTASAAAHFSRAMQDGRFQKEYLAVLTGIPELPSATLTDLLYHDPRRNKTFLVTRKRRGVREAALRYEMRAQADTQALVQVRLLTGRTHQIRAQFAGRALPLAGDGAYGGGSGAIGLWSYRLQFPTPDGIMLEFTKNPPDSPPFSKFSL